MSVVQSGAQCPFCLAEVPPKVSECPACHARKQPRRGMSPLAFKTYALTWLACTTVLVLSACYLALLPWLPERDAPPYALRLLGAAPTPSRCKVEVVHGPSTASPASPAVDAGACAATVPPPGSVAAAPAPDPTRRRIAATLHGALVLSLAALLSWLLHRGLKALFTRPASSTWVRRTA
jgi:hypothetical protein